MSGTSKIIDISNQINPVEIAESLKILYYSENSKNILFKKNQKNDCAKFICSHININSLIEKAVYVLPNSNIIFVNYKIFKLFAYSDIYNDIIKHIMDLFDYCIQYYGWFEVNLDLESFTVSAAERYNPAIRQFCNSCLINGTIYTKCMQHFRILNTPLVMDMIITVIKPFVEKDVINKLTFFNKSETVEYVEKTIK
jgi:hypothetical protein